MKTPQFAICILNHNYPASLEMRKLYEVVADSEAEKTGQIRIIDESGEDYLYPAKMFDTVTLPKQVIEHILTARAA